MNSSNLTKQQIVKNEIASPPPLNGNGELIEVKTEKIG